MFDLEYELDNIKKTENILILYNKEIPEIDYTNISGTKKLMYLSKDSNKKKFSSAYFYDIINMDSILDFKFDVLIIFNCLNKIKDLDKIIQYKNNDCKNLIIKIHQKDEIIIMHSKKRKK
jgi:hypothetical protein